jgi:hypothetical protein
MLEQAPESHWWFSVILSEAKDLRGAMRLPLWFCTALHCGYSIH